MNETSTIEFGAKDILVTLIKHPRTTPVKPLFAMLAAATLPFAPAAAQRSNPNSTEDQASTRSAPDLTGTTAAATQTQSVSSQRPYQPDEIKANGRPIVEDSESPRNGSETGNYAALRAAAPNEFEIFASTVADKQIRRFGANLLVPGARDFTAPPNTTVPEDYKINAGDTLLIGLAGSADADNLALTVDSEGRIFIPRVGSVRVGGLRYGDLQSAISVQIARVYHNFRLSVTIGKLHGITVYVTGFALTPGSYTISSLSTLVNAVLAAGGPSGGGSFRSIQLRRNGRLISDFDLYDFLLKGDKSADSLLQNGDVIFITPVGAQVAAIGSVNNEAVFEARSRDTLTDILLYAGGVNSVADTSRLLALDPLNLKGGWRLLTPAEAKTQIAGRALVLRVLSDLGIARSLADQQALVTLSGEVVHPGRYFVAAGTPLATVIAQAGGLTPNAYVFAAALTRETLRQQQRSSYDAAVRDAEYLLAATPLTSVLSTGTDIDRTSQLRSIVNQLRQRLPEGRLIFDVMPDVTRLPDGLIVENNDALFIPPRPVSVGVFGSVPSPSSFQFRTRATIGDYVNQAGGVQKIGDRSRIFVIRANGASMSSKPGLVRGSILNQRALPGDLIYVPINPSRGELWRKLGILTSGFTGLATAATLAVVAK